MSNLSHSQFVDEDSRTVIVRFLMEEKMLHWLSSLNYPI